MAKDLVSAPDIKEIVEALKERYPNCLSNVNPERILFRRDLAPKSGKRRVFAYVSKVAELDKDINPNFDYHFIVNDDNVKEFSPAQLHALCFHESLHIGGTDTDNNGVDRVKLLDHDVKEFRLVGDTLGYNWHEDDTCRDLLGNEDIELILPPEPPKDGDEEQENFK